MYNSEQFFYILTEYVDALDNNLIKGIYWNNLPKTKSWQNCPSQADCHKPMFAN